jgi:hypothetical protein
MRAPRVLATACTRGLPSRRCALTVRSSRDLHRRGTWPACPSFLSSVSRAKRHPGSGPSAQTLGITERLKCGPFHPSTLNLRIAQSDMRTLCQPTLVPLGR